MNDTVAPLRVLAVMENARLEVADQAMLYWSVRYEDGPYRRQLHDRLMRACETYAAARDMVIEP
jgi:hypothetical protein